MRTGSGSPHNVLDRCNLQAGQWSATPFSKWISLPTNGVHILTVTVLTERPFGKNTARAAPRRQRQALILERGCNPHAHQLHKRRQPRGRADKLHRSGSQQHRIGRGLVRNCKVLTELRLHDNLGLLAQECMLRC